MIEFTHVRKIVKKQLPVFLFYNFVIDRLFETAKQKVEHSPLSAIGLD